MGIAALFLAAATAACSSSGDTGSSGGWRVTGGNIRIAGAAHDCPTPAPVLDTFTGTPSPNPDCSPAPKSGASPAPDSQATAAPQTWQRVHTEDYHAASSGWHTIYTTYTAPPGTGVYQPLVNATEQPMPTPFDTPAPTPTPAPLYTTAPAQPSPSAIATPLPMPR